MSAAPAPKGPYRTPAPRDAPPPAPPRDQGPRANVVMFRSLLFVAVLLAVTTVSQVDPVLAALVGCALLSMAR